MQFDILSLFPAALEGYYQSSILGRAQKQKLIRIRNFDLRDWARNKHRRGDDTPYGGGPGMVIRVDVVHRALTGIYTKKNKKTRVVLLTPRGKTFDQRAARRLLVYERVILIAGRYEAIDGRVDAYVDEKISIGDFVLTGGELAAACVIDAVSRLIPGVLGKEESMREESFDSFTKHGTTVEYPQYTKPENFRGARVPSVLLSGHHQKIKDWRTKHRKRKAIG